METDVSTHVIPVVTTEDLPIEWPDSVPWLEPRKMITRAYLLRLLTRTFPNPVARSLFLLVLTQLARERNDPLTILLLHQFIAVAGEDWNRACEAFGYVHWA